MKPICDFVSSTHMFKRVIKGINRPLTFDPATNTLMTTSSGPG